MNRFKDINAKSFPAYTWLWNDRITKEGITERVDDMYSRGIRAMYIMGEPKRFRPTIRKTFLDPDYLTDEYFKMLEYAMDYAKSKGMYTWFYNEGGYPSGSACGQVLDENPSLYRKEIEVKEIILPKNTVYTESEGSLAAFCSEKRIKNGFVSDKEEVIFEYHAVRFAPFSAIDTDIACRETTDTFIKLTHEKLKKAFGAEKISQSPYMFDDESKMGSWTEGLEKLFLEEYKYDLCDYLPVISEDREPQNFNEQKALMDYHELCGKLVYNNYFIPMKNWLNKNNMLSVGHLDCEHQIEGFKVQHYGNSMKLYKAFDIPGIDVIWNQISYPVNGKCCKDGFEFFPRVASSAARQMGTNITLSESFAVCSDSIDYEEMRYIIGHQAVRGINLFNFMAMSYGKEGGLPFQFRPNFIPDTPGRNLLSDINGYTARLSYILQSGIARIKTALYYPYRTINAGAIEMKEAIKSFENLGDMLESNGVSFDIIDEEFVLHSKCENGALIGEHVCYENVFMPEAAYEKAEVKEKINTLNKNIVPDAKCSSYLKTRFIDCEDKTYCFIFNESGEAVNENIFIKDSRSIYAINLITGEIYIPRHKKCGEGYEIDVTLTRGDGTVIMFSDEVISADILPKYDVLCDVEVQEACVLREYVIDEDCGITNTYFNEHEKSIDEINLDDFSGQLLYEIKASTDIPEGAILDLGTVVSSAGVFVNNKSVGYNTMPPYQIKLPKILKGQIIKVKVENTGARACASTNFFIKTDHSYLCSHYQEFMVPEEKKANSIGIKGQIKILIQK